MKRRMMWGCREMRMVPTPGKDKPESVELTTFTSLNKSEVIDFASDVNGKLARVAVYK
jgi:hypothetical protein